MEDANTSFKAVLQPMQYRFSIITWISFMNLKDDRLWLRLR